MKAKMKKALRWVWSFFKFFVLWAKELFYIRMQNGKTYWKESSTKLFRTVGFILFYAVISLIIVVFWYKVFGPNRELREEITIELLSTFLGLGGILTILVGFLQWMYSKHKKEDVRQMEKHYENIPGACKKEDVIE